MCTTCGRETTTNYHYHYGLTSVHRDDYSVACDVPEPSMARMPADTLAMYITNGE